jgi:hypothetical protein
MKCLSPGGSCGILNFRKNQNIKMGNLGIIYFTRIGYDDFDLRYYFGQKGFTFGIMKPIGQKRT